jgi:hypothetical protein
MSRRVTLTLAVLSALLLALTLYGWLESCRPVFVRSCRGKLVLLFVDPSQELTFSPMNGESAWQFASTWRGQATVDVNRAGFDFFHAGDLTLFAIPYPYLAVLTAGLTACVVFLHRRQQLRLTHNRCLACGYDLRATTSGRCPECGTPCPARQ